MQSVRYLGAIGGEGTTNVPALPANTVFRLAKGYTLMANVHFLNVGSQTIQGQAVLDVKYATPAATDRVLGLFTNLDDSFSIPASSNYSLDVNCTAKNDLNFLMVADHMHGLGTSIFTELVRADGTHVSMVQDNTWTSEMQFNPTFTVFSAEQPFQIKAGDQIHTHCTWNNPGSSPVTFPDEMCVGIGFYYAPDGATGAPEINCIKGVWGN
jgi:hypothetical protein